MKDLTICIKTFMRPKTLDKCLTSIRQHYPDVRILVANDGPDPIVNDKASEIFNLSFDVGLSAGRNFLLSKVETKFFMLIDDDIIFPKTINLQKVIEFLQKNDEIDLAAALVVNNVWHGSIEKRGDHMIRFFGKPCRFHKNIPLFDFTENQFIAKTKSFEGIFWDEDLKIREHMEFFYRNKGKLNCTVLQDFNLIDLHTREGDYSKFRFGNRNQLFGELQLKKIGIKSFIDRRFK